MYAPMTMNLLNITVKLGSSLSATESNVTNAICQSKLDAATTDAMRSVIRIYAISVIWEIRKITRKTQVEKITPTL